MKPERIAFMTEKYEEALRRVGIRPVEIKKDLLMPGVEQASCHAMWMLPKIRDFLKEGRTDKAERWFCFVQGVMWISGFFSIDDMREHNTQPDETAGNTAS